MIETNWEGVEGGATSSVEGRKKNMVATINIVVAEHSSGRGDKGMLRAGW